MTTNETGARGCRAIAVAAMTMTLGLTGACVDRLPEEDLRITTAVPAAKLSADLLWQEFKEDPVAARGRYFGKAVEITGVASSVPAPDDPAPVIRFDVEGERGVRASLIRDRAAGVIGSLKAGDRLTLRCFCEGQAGDVVLKSCIRP